MTTAPRAGLSSEYVDLIARFVALVRTEGLPIRDYRDPKKCYFDLLPFDQKEQVIECLRVYVEVCEDVARNGHKLLDDRQFLWRMIGRMGLRLTSDIFDRLRSDEVIEIYDGRFVQVFRNLRFFAVCSYSIDEILCRPFWELYRRDDDISAQILAIGIQMFTATNPSTVEYGIGPHEQLEIDSPGGYKWLIESRLLSPLFDDAGRVCAAINVVTPIERRS